MRKTLALLVAAGLVMAAFAAPGAVAAKKKKKQKPKKIEESASLTALPFPNYSSNTGTPTPGCSAGEEGVHKVTTDLHVPGKGKLTVDLSGFEGDWDVYVFGPNDLVLGRSEAVQVPDGAPPEEQVIVAFKKMADIAIVGCNWAGGPQAELHYKLLYIPAKGKHAHH